MKKPKLIFNPPNSINDIFLGASKKDINILLGECEGKDFEDANYGYRDREWFFNHELCIYYDKEGLVEFLEVYGYGSEYKSTEIYGIEVFETTADELIEHIQNMSATTYLGDSAEFPYTYIFYDLQLTLWRNSLPDENNLTVPLDEFGSGHYFLAIGLGTHKCLEKFI